MDPLSVCPWDGDATSRVLEATQHGLPGRRSIYAALHSSGSPRARCLHHVPEPSILGCLHLGVMVGSIDLTSHPEISHLVVLRIYDT